MPRAARWSVLGNFRKRSGLLSIERKRGDSHLMRIEPREVLKRGSFPLSGIKVLAFAFLGVASSTALARAQQMPPSQAAPVIPEDEFEQAVPPLDPELDRDRKSTRLNSSH